MTLSQKIIKTALLKNIHTRDEFFALAKKIASAEKSTPPRISELRQVYLNLIAKEQKSQLKNPPHSPFLKGGSRGSLPFKKGESERDFLDKILQKRAVRTLSGVAIITVLTKPYPCPGKCVYCPTEARMPKSYLSNEPAAARALRLKFNPFNQVRERLKTLEANGHPTDKIELIVKGGTWSAYPWKYQMWFIGECFRACNKNPPQSPFLKGGSSSKQSPFGKGGGKGDLRNEQKKNETAKHRIIGLTLETRPDWITPQEILRMRELGCTRVELGVQHTDDKILKLIKRGHNLTRVKEATKLLKNAGFKVDYHLMPMLPGATPQKDFKMFEKVFADPELRPDMVKIYPCSVVKGSKLYQWWKQKKYKPYSNKKLIELLIKVKTKIIPRYCRISRLIRDIPSTSIEAGNRVTNLREVIQREIKKLGLKCKCLRCHEIGHQNPPQSPFLKGGGSSHLSPFGKGGRKGDLKVFIDKYDASDGKEYFLSIEDKKRNIVYAFCRLRLPPLAVIARSEHNERRGDPLHQWDCFAPLAMTPLIDSALIRELHTYGHLISINKDGSSPLMGEVRRGWKDKNSPSPFPSHPGRGNFEVQHTGLGKSLMKKAEEVARQQGYKKIAVISGIGVREYYRKLGFRQQGTYMVKSI
ncbi:MAG: tRNA uridine(34) 5-carboxymethylaminomethyl modification radical SAM/GNAT enzyme Elp3 [bacterium]|nr:tRNA uridine(34) 5-carboxymethylaminomethyl modification radical SAM/GNAT enzyme Elp3 [bacterium]